MISMILYLRRCLRLADCLENWSGYTSGYSESPTQSREPRTLNYEGFLKYGADNREHYARIGMLRERNWPIEFREWINCPNMDRQVHRVVAQLDSVSVWVKEGTFVCFPDCVGTDGEFQLRGQRNLGRWAGGALRSTLDFRICGYFSLNASSTAMIM